MSHDGDRSIIYVSCPYTHVDPAVVARRLQIFADYVGGLERSGVYHAVSALFNQMLLDRGIQLPADYGFWKSYSRTLIGVSQEIHVICLTGWEASVGVSDEIEHGLRLGKKIRHVTHYNEAHPSWSSR